MLARLSILHFILAGLFVAAWQFGLLGVLWQADHVFAFPIMGVLIAVSVGLLAIGWKVDALWLADKLPIVGLACTVIALLLASKDGTSLDDVNFKREILQALIGNLLGVLGYGWVELCARYGR